MLTKKWLCRVKPIEKHIPDPSSEKWDLADGRFHKASKNGARKVLLVRHAFPARGKKGEEKDLSPQDSREDYFYIDVPKHFFAVSTDDDGELGDFIANPLYKHTDVLVVRWTGYGKYSGWIDTNVQMRGAGIGAVIEQGGVACAKWS